MGSLLLVRDYIPELCWCETKNLLPDSVHGVRPGKTSLLRSVIWVCVKSEREVPQIVEVIFWKYIVFCGILKLFIINFNSIYISLCVHTFIHKERKGFLEFSKFHETVFEFQRKANLRRIVLLMRISSVFKL